MESQATLVSEANSQSDTPATLRLVIRVKITQEEPLQAPVRRRLSRGALLLMLGAVAVLLSWAGISLFKTDAPSATAATEGTPKSAAQSPAPAPARGEFAPVPSDEPLPSHREQPDLPPSPINEVIPDVPRSALETIRGTIRVSVRVIIDKEGMVRVAIAEDRGPSRYFERLAVETSRKWTFTPATSAKERSMLVKFNFTRTGATAHVASATSLTPE